MHQEAATTRNHRSLCRVPRHLQGRPRSQNVSSSETFDFAQGLTALSGPRAEVPRRGAAPSRGLGRHLPQPVRSRRRSDAGWVPGAALDGGGQAKRHRAPRAQ